MLMIACTLLAYGADRLSKWYITSHLLIGERISIFPFLDWLYVENSGAAFSFGSGMTWIFTLVMVGVTGAVVLAACRLASPWWGAGLGILLGGTLGNLTDRLFRPPGFGIGRVVDFIALPHFAVFNLADSAIIVAAVVLCCLVFRGVPLNPRRLARDRSATIRPIHSRRPADD